LEKDIKPADFNIHTMFERIKEKKGFLFEETLICKQSLDKAIEELKIIM
jgi:DNA primase